MKYEMLCVVHHLTNRRFLLPSSLNALLAIIHLKVLLRAVLIEGILFILVRKRVPGLRLGSRSPPGRSSSSGSSFLRRDRRQTVVQIIIVVIAEDVVGERVDRLVLVFVVGDDLLQPGVGRLAQCACLGLLGSVGLRGRRQSLRRGGGGSLLGLESAVGLGSGGSLELGCYLAGGSLGLGLSGRFGPLLRRKRLGALRCGLELGVLVDRRR